MLRAMAGGSLVLASSNAMTVEPLQAWPKQHVKQATQSGAMQDPTTVATITAGHMKLGFLLQEGPMTQVRWEEGWEASMTWGESRFKEQRV